MKGLELCHKYFMTYGEEMIKKKFYSYRHKIAAGLVGQGSECFGFDDAISRDHDWGPGFCLWLDNEDFNAIGIQLQEEYEKLPEEFMGFVRKADISSGKRVGVFKINDFYEWFTGLTQAPENHKQWINLLDEYLCACTNGKVFYDPLGKFSDIRKKFLSFYPEDIRKVKIAAKCISCAQSGQYNFARSLKRQESFAVMYAQNAFCSDIISLVFLLNRKFAPFYKWKHRAVRELPVLGALTYEGIDKMLEQNDYQKKIEIIENICSAVISELKAEGLSYSESDFLLDHGRSVQERIKDNNVRARAI